MLFWTIALTFLLGINQGNVSMAANNSAATREISKVKRVEITQVQPPKGHDIFERFAKRGIELRAAANLVSAENLQGQEVTDCADKLANVLDKLPASHVKNLKNLKVYFDPEGRRGLGGGNTIIIRCAEVEDPELSAVLIHEMGHVLDSALNGKSRENSSFMDGKKPIKIDDPSLGFYQISWLNEEELAKDQKPENFVTGYAMTNPFEDFAESYAFYFLHGNKFRQMKEQNPALAKKYDFMRNSVFFKREFSFDQPQITASKSQRNYDSTVLEYNYKNLLAF